MKFSKRKCFFQPSINRENILRRSKIKKKILPSQKNREIMNDPEIYSPYLIQVCLQGNLILAKALVQKGANLNYTDVNINNI